MNLNVDWLARLNRDRKGIWGVTNQYDSARGGNCVSSSTPRELQLEEVYIFIDDDKTLFKDKNDELHELELGVIAHKAEGLASDFDRSSVRIIIYDFQLANNEEQASLIKTARSIQESAGSIPFQFVFCGAWSYFSFCENYYETHGKTSSPAAEYKNILYVPEMTSSDALDKLIKANLVAKPTEIDLIASDLLIERTAGNDFLIGKVLEYLQDKGGSWIDNVEFVLEELIVAHDVIDNIKEKVNSLNSASKDELQKLLQVHRLVRSSESIVSEQLWLAGLIKRTSLRNSKQLIQISCPLVNSVLRNIALEVGLKSCAYAGDLCLEGTTISSFAYNKVAEIENLLRCLVVSEWYIECTDNWPENLNRVKTPAFERTEQEDLINLVIKCMKNEFPRLMNGTGPEPEPKVEPVEVEIKARNKRKHESLLESAQNWQERQEAHHALDLAKNNVMHFMTTENLEKVLVDKKVGLTREGSMFDKRYLQTTLEEYRAIRSAIAHNQPITLTTINRLDDLMRKISDWITAYIDRV